MKTKKLLMIMTVFCLFIVFSASESMAQVWAVCTVAEAGQSTTTGDVYVKLDEVSDANWSGEQYYVCTGTDKNAVLATALTAVSTGYQVNVKLSSYSEWSIIQSFYCMDQ
jgi:uncharacterized protein YpmB